MKTSTRSFRPIRNGLFIGICSLLGSLTLYCGDSMQSSGEAEAQPPTFVKLAEGKLNSGDSSPTLNVSGYAELMLYTVGTAGLEDRCNFPYLRTKFRMDPAVAFSISATAGSFPMREGGRIRVEGTEMQLYLQTASQLPCAGSSITYIIAGIK